MDQQIGALMAERGALVGALTAGQPSAGQPFEGQPVAGRPWPSADQHVAGPTVPRKTVSGQQVLLGLGAVMLLSAAAFFLLIVWLIVGLVGQALIMAALTGAAVAGAVAATRRGLPAAAETAAVIATGFLLIDLSAAHALGLAGLDGLSAASYWTGASLLGGALLIGFDKVVPRAANGIALRKIVIYRPAAALLFASTPWFMCAAVEPGGGWLPVALLGVALVNLVGAIVALRIDERRPAPAANSLAGMPQAATPPPSRPPVSAMVLLASAGLATAAHAVAGLAIGYDPQQHQGDRYAAFGVLLAVPVLLALLSTRLGAGVTGPLGEPRTRMIPAVGVAWAGAALIIPLMDATPVVLGVLSVLVAGAVSARHLRHVSPVGPSGDGWLRALSIGAHVTQPVLFIVAFVLVVAEHRSLRWMLLLDGLPSSAESSAIWMVLPAAVWALSSVLGAVRRRSVAWVVVAQVATLSTLVAALWDTNPRTWMSVLLVAFACMVGLAWVAVRRGSYALVAPVGAGLHGDSFWAGIDRSAVGFGAVYAAGAVVATVDLSPGYQSFALVSVGVLTLVYAAAPTRLPFAYLGSVAIWAGTANLLREAGIDTTEAYTAPLVLLLAAIGFVQWRRDRTLPTLLIMGPALSVALGPSLLTSLGEGDELRLAAVTAAAIAAVVIGLSKRWKAPVTVGGLVLLVVAVTQGGPLAAYVPVWFILGVGGAVLIAVGIAWERAVVAGRRTATWYATLD